MCQIKNAQKDLDFFLQDSKTMKLGWEDTYSESWCEQIVLCTP